MSSEKSAPQSKPQDAYKFAHALADRLVNLFCGEIRWVPKFRDVILEELLKQAALAASSPVAQAPDVEAISAKVHEQWMESKRAKGVTSRKSESGEELMVPYAQLSESAKDLDRGSVSAVLKAIASMTLAASPTVPMGSPELTFAEFSQINRQRCEHPRGFNHKLSSWSTSDWITAVLGELGEAANVVKKLNRYRDGIPGNKLPESELRDQLRKEIGDVFVYLDLISQSLGFSIAEAAVEVFNAKSEQIGYPAKLEAASLPLEREEKE